MRKRKVILNVLVMLILIKEVIEMKYIEMTVEQALKLSRGNKNMKVLVAVYDLENDNEIVPFEKKSRLEYEKIIKKSKTIARIPDDFIGSLRCFSIKQDLKSIEPKGKMSTVLMME